MKEIQIHLEPSLFSEKERLFASDEHFRISLFRYETGVAAARIANARGELLVLPYLGQILWDAKFDGVRLGMDSMFKMPRPASSILGTYGCLNYHAGLLRNGVPGDEDDHPLHGELPCAPMDAAWLEFGDSASGPFVRLVSEYTFAQGFGANYVARPSVTLGAGETQFEIGLDAQNLASAPMDLMYLCHLNFAFCEGGRLIQPAPFTPDRTAVRVKVPSHVIPTPAYLQLLDQLATNPGSMQTLDRADQFDPEQVFYINRPCKGADGLTHFLMRRPEGDGFTVSFDPDILSHTVRWLYNSGAQRVAAFALPATCHPEGYTAEKRKGNVRKLAGGASVAFRVRAGYVDPAAASALEKQIGDSSR